MRYSRLLAHYPYVVIGMVSVFVAVCLLVTFIMGQTPDFSDPTLGFEPRGTTIGARIRTHEKLLDETHSDMTFATNTYHYFNKQLYHRPGNRSDVKMKVKNKNKGRSGKRIRLQLNISDPFFCGPPQKEYARYTFKSSTDSSIFTFENIRAICNTDASLRKHKTFRDVCVKKTHSEDCCRSWSLPNYVALLSNRSSCHNITQTDVSKVLELLEQCASFYRKMMLTPDCDGSEINDPNINECAKIPASCKRQNAVYYLLHYITDVQFMQKKSYGGGRMLRYAMTLLPVATGTAAEPVYWTLVNQDHQINMQQRASDVQIYAVNFGIKHLLFDHYLRSDLVWFVVAAIFLLVAMWLYSTSLFITVIAVLNIFFALEMAYFLYTFVMEITFFPFMNLLAIVILIGIGFDDIFIYCKVWNLAKLEKNIGTLEKIISDSLKHALLSMLVTSFTTAGAFYASIVSNITALKCFAIFAGTAVIVNYILMITLIPSAMVIYEKWCSECTSCSSAYQITGYFICKLPFKLYYTMCEWTRILFEKLLPCIVVRVRYFWLLTFGGVAVFGMIVIFYHPRLRLPSSNEFQVFSLHHPFEVYDFRIKDEFWFEKAAGASNPTMPLTVVWGVKAVDNSNKLDPYSQVTLEFDTALNVTSLEAQEWLLNFCRALRSTEMYQTSSGPQLTNCFIEGFKRFMGRGCEGLGGENYSPCCRTSKFPFEPSVFLQCIRVYRQVLTQTPSLYFSNNQAGLRYDRDNGNIVALIIEFSSKHPFTFNYKSMKKFFKYMDTWTVEQLRTAPSGLRGGWFVSHLEFFDLQNSIAQGTPVAIGVSIAIATVVAFLTTLNVLITIHAMLSITGAIFTTVGILVMLGWELNILESVTISIAVGLSIDFTLHYAMAYRLSPHLDREMRVVTSISRMGSPVGMAALTTFLVGAIMLPSTVLAYRKLGIFLMIVMSVSWAFATFFFQALLRTLGPPGGFGQFTWPSSDCMDRERDHVDKTVYTTSESTLSSVGNHGGSSAEMHELEPLTMMERQDNMHPYRNANHRHNPRSRYQHRLSIASTSSGGSDSPRSRTNEISAGAIGTGKTVGTPVNSRGSGISSIGNGGRGSITAGEKCTGNVSPRICDRSDGTQCANDPNRCNVNSERSRYPGESMKNTVVSLKSSDSTSESQTTVQLVAQTTAPLRPEAQGTQEPFIPTDSNSNRTDMNTDKHNDTSSAESGTGSSVIWLKQSVPVADL